MPQLVCYFIQTFHHSFGTRQLKNTKATARPPKYHNKKAGGRLLGISLVSFMRTAEGYMKQLNDVKTSEDCKKLYNEWASTFEKDCIENYGYVGHKQVIKVLSRLMPTLNLEGKEVKILDVGCGTGLLGELVQNELSKVEDMHVDLQIDGLDLTEAMIDEAKSRDVYSELWNADLNENLPEGVDLGSYDLVVSSGAFRAGQLGPSSLEHLLQPLKPGGLACFTVDLKAWEKESYQQALKKLVSDGECIIRQINRADYLPALRKDCSVVVLAKTKSQDNIVQE